MILRQIMKKNLIEVDFKSKQKNKSSLDKSIKEENNKEKKKPARKTDAENNFNTQNKIFDLFIGKYHYLKASYTTLVRYKSFSEFNTERRGYMGLRKLRKSFLIKENQFVTNLSELAEIFGKDKRDVKRELDIFAEMGVIELEHLSTQYILITITNNLKKTVQEADAAVPNSRTSKSGKCHLSKNEKKNPKVANATFQNSEKCQVPPFEQNPSSVSLITNNKITKNIYTCPDGSKKSLEEIEKHLDENRQGWRDQDKSRLAINLSYEGYCKETLLALLGFDDNGNPPPLNENQAGAYWHGRCSPKEGRCEFAVSDFVKAILKIKNILGEVSYEDILGMIEYALSDEDTVKYHGNEFLSPKLVKAEKNGVLLVVKIFNQYKAFLKKSEKRNGRY